MTTVNVKPLVEALAWVKANPDLHDQINAETCLIGHWVRAQDDFDHLLSASVDYFTSATGLPREKVSKLFTTSDNYNAIDYAEHLIREYTVIESGDLPVGTRVKHNNFNYGEGKVVSHFDSCGLHWNRVQWDDGREDGYKPSVLTVIDTPASAVVSDVDYYVRASGGIEYSTRDIEWARGVADYLTYASSNVTITRVATTTTEEIVS